MYMYRVTQKSDNKDDWDLACMFMIVGARFRHSWIGWKEVLNPRFVGKIVHRIGSFADA